MWVRALGTSLGTQRYSKCLLICICILLDQAYLCGLPAFPVALPELALTAEWPSTLLGQGTHNYYDVPSLELTGGPSAIGCPCPEPDKSLFESILQTDPSGVMPSSFWVVLSSK